MTLATIGDQAFAETTIAIARARGVLAWLLPVPRPRLLRRRHRPVEGPLADGGTGRAGADVGAGGVGVVLVVGGVLVRQLDDDTLGGACRRRMDVMVRPMRWASPCWRPAGDDAGLRLVGADGARRPRTRPRRRVAAAANAPPAWWRAVIAVLVGIAAIADPMGLIEPLIVVAGVGPRALRDHRGRVRRRRRPAQPRRQRRGGAPVDGAPAALAIAALAGLA